MIPGHSAIVGHRGPSGPLVQLDVDSANYHQFDATNPTYAGVIFTALGSQRSLGPGIADETHELTWLLRGVAADYWVRCTLNSGTLEPGADSTGIWITMDTDNRWYIRDGDSGPSAVDASITIDIATDSGGSNIIATETYTPQANWFA